MPNLYINGPDGGPSGVESEPFDIILLGGAMDGFSVTVTTDDPACVIKFYLPSGDYDGGGTGAATYTPLSGSLFRMTLTPPPTANGDISIALTNDGGWDNPGPTTYTVDRAWVYANQQDVEDLIHVLNTNVAFDLDNDGNIDADAVYRAGTAMDGYINLKLRQASLPAPNPLTDTDIAAVLRQASAHLTVWYGWHQRGLDAADNPALQGIAGIMEGYKAYADELLAGAIAVLQGEDTDDDAEATGTFGFVPVTRSACTTDENSSG